MWLSDIKKKGSIVQFRNISEMLFRIMQKKMSKFDVNDLPREAYILELLGNIILDSMQFA